MRDRNEPNEVKMQIRIMIEKLKEAMPISVQKKFPWKKAESILVNRLLFLAREASNWSLISFFVFSSFQGGVFGSKLKRPKRHHRIDGNNFEKNIKSGSPVVGVDNKSTDSLTTGTWTSTLSQTSLCQPIEIR